MGWAGWDWVPDYLSFINPACTTSATCTTCTGGTDVAGGTGSAGGAGSTGVTCSYRWCHLSLTAKSALPSPPQVVRVVGILHSPDPDGYLPAFSSLQDLAYHTRQLGCMVRAALVNTGTAPLALNAVKVGEVMAPHVVLSR